MEKISSVIAVKSEHARVCKTFLMFYKRVLVHMKKTIYASVET